MTSALDAFYDDSMDLGVIHVFVIVSRYRGPVLEARGAEPSDKTGGGGERATAARHPGALGETEPCE